MMTHYEKIIPSQVRYTEFVWATRDCSKNEDTTYAGKWMLFVSLAECENELTELDNLWKVIQRTMNRNDKYFYKASASTSMKTQFSNDEYGVICIHTTDYENKNEILLTAIKIQLLLNSTNTELCNPLEYKTCEETRNGYNKRPNMYRFKCSKGEIQLFRYETSGYEEIYRNNINIAITSLLPKANGPKNRLSIGQSENFFGFLEPPTQIVANQVEASNDGSSQFNEEYNSSQPEEECEWTPVTPEKESTRQLIPGELKKKRVISLEDEVTHPLLLKRYRLVN